MNQPSREIPRQDMNKQSVGKETKDECKCFRECSTACRRGGRQNTIVDGLIVCIPTKPNNSFPKSWCFCFPTIDGRIVHNKPD